MEYETIRDVPIEANETETNGSQNHYNNNERGTAQRNEVRKQNRLTDIH